MTAARLDLAAAVVAAIVKTILGSPPTPNAERVVPTRRDRTSTHGHLAGIRLNNRSRRRAAKPTTEDRPIDGRLTLITT
ncbi:hypothetical protein LRQ08_30840 (plasmid) [Rhodococcus qingshengii]|uniref:hypothetical protein n=1 Tax=Rhodococcus qingshengii TaxID=334542 RepID=UPI002113228E|nr:hypothetical protein [Rhodococcus qingshengii]UUE28342.1 hypothetical protein LRQ08_30840 [Rhodococcus qingshengii]